MWHDPFVGVPGVTFIKTTNPYQDVKAYTNHCCTRVKARNSEIKAFELLKERQVSFVLTTQPIFIHIEKEVSENENKTVLRMFGFCLHCQHCRRV